MGEEDAIIIDDEDEQEECDMRLMKTKRLPLMMKICENEHSRATRQACCIPNTSSRRLSLDAKKHYVI